MACVVLPRVMQGDLVRRRVMQRRHEAGVSGDLDAPADQALPGFRIVEKRCKHPRGDLARVSATGAAMIGAFMRIVRHVCPVADKKHQWREHVPQAHRTENPGRKIRLGLAIQRLEKARGWLATGPAPPAKAQRVSHQLDPVERASRLDKGEGRHRRLAEPAEGPRRRFPIRVCASSLAVVRLVEASDGFSNTGRCASTSSEPWGVWARGSPKNPANPSVSMPGACASRARRKTSDRTSMQNAACSAGRTS